MNKRIVAAAIVALLAVGFIVAFQQGIIPGTASGTYYTQIDNAKVSEQESKGGVIDFTGGMPYLYTLSCYDEKGDEQELSFGTERKLREGAYLKLNVVPIRGVMDWSEVQFDDLPIAVQRKME